MEGDKAYLDRLRAVESLTNTHFVGFCRPPTPRKQAKNTCFRDLKSPGRGLGRVDPFDVLKTLAEWGFFGLRMGIRGGPDTILIPLTTLPASSRYVLKEGASEEHNLLSTSNTTVPT